MKRSGYVTVILSRFFAFFCPLKSFRVTQIQWFQKPLSLLKNKFFLACLKIEYHQIHGFHNSQLSVNRTSGVYHIPQGLLVTRSGTQIWSY